MNDDIRRRAVATPNGELAWRRADVVAAVAAYREDAQAILGGEIWVVLNGAFYPQPPLESGGTAVIAWDVTARRPREAWPEFVKRTAAESLAEIEALKAENAVLSSLRDGISYNLYVVSESEYEASLSAGPEH